jgi:hypothetical protein
LLCAGCAASPKYAGSQNIGDPVVVSFFQTATMEQLRVAREREVMLLHKGQVVQRSLDGAKSQAKAGMTELGKFFDDLIAAVNVQRAALESSLQAQQKAVLQVRLWFFHS